jgi:methylmalonyl-CoA/ethylmalonyl-CoA epimerase
VLIDLPLVTESLFNSVDSHSIGYLSIKRFVYGGQTMLPSMLGQVPISQIGLVVPNLELAMRQYHQVLGLAPWKVYSNNAPPLKCLYHGRPASYRVRVGMARSGQVQVELIEYIEGDTIHRDFIASGRKGLEHVGMLVPDLDQALHPFKKMDIAILQQVDGLGVDGDGRYAYLDTEPIFGTVLELIQSPSQPRPPEKIYPMIY